MSNITNVILGSLKLRYLDTRERWVWVALNLLNDNANGLICRSNGECYNLLELSELIMLDSDKLKDSLYILAEKNFISLEDDINKIKLLLTPEEERKNKLRIAARLRKRRQRSKEMKGMVKVDV
ncbi:hypothetical protein Desaci_4060 [Desulfosporosinus acidiphilus SJ4]|uniref:Uncharacterized protein n=1 Tax=Desulfosporosinus acidiphilus (strain DSM 22704 / JCM 16185 / SJ4) TaxID=646529 RepID=I4DAV0_DESAJ|nr:hypothetical protein [Desulfosporosinus acidiphilus]AFM42924.1 hypothetical protein Desaci_4060 [Desulfosporosinus acidiphilus SJ4]